MDTQYDSIGESGLQFFAKVSASIAHELKNVLAIINENAGLLEDMSLVAQRGTAIDAERLNKTCQQFFKQIHRADRIIRDMSRFAHSTDQVEEDIDLHELVELVSNLAGRLAAQRRISLQAVQPQEAVHMGTHTFLLENLVWLCLEFAIETTSPGQTLILTPEKTDTGIFLHIAPIDGLANAFPDHMPEGYEEVLAALGARLVADFGTNALTLLLA